MMITETPQTAAAANQDFAADAATEQQGGALPPCTSMPRPRMAGHQGHVAAGEIARKEAPKQRNIKIICISALIGVLAGLVTVFYRYALT